MFIRVVARVLETNEDLLLQGIEPKDISYIWAVRYVKIYDIDEFEALTSEKTKKTVIYRCDKPAVLIRENVDEFARRLIEETKKLEKMDEEIEISDDETEQIAPDSAEEEDDE